MTRLTYGFNFLMEYKSGLKTKSRPSEILYSEWTSEITVIPNFQDKPVS